MERRSFGTSVGGEWFERAGREPREERRYAAGEGRGLELDYSTLRPAAFTSAALLLISSLM